MAKDKFHKYIWLINTIYQAKAISFEEINSKWIESILSEGIDMSKKSFHNYKAAIEDIFNITIGCNIKAGYKYYIENFEDLEQGELQHWLLNTFTVSNLTSESRQLRSRIQLEEIPSGQHFLAPIIEAMRNGFSIEIKHQNFLKEETKTVEIAPYFIKIFKQRWYVIAYNKEADKVMTYALDRIQRLTITTNSFEYPKGFNPQEYYLHCYGIINDEHIKPCIIKVKASAFQAKYLRSLPLHHSQTEVEIAQKYSIFEYYIKPSFDFRKELLSMGAEIEILSPEWFREEMSYTTHSMNNIYS